MTITTDATLGSLGNATTQPLARVSYQAAWYDGIGRPVATANYGTNGNQALTPSVVVPTPSDTVLVTTTAYNQRGEAYQTTDPAGKTSHAEFDDAGRQITQIQNYVDGVANVGTQADADSRLSDDAQPLTAEKLGLESTFRDRGRPRKRE